MIIDSDNYKAAGIETMFFPDGMPHAKLTKQLDRDNLLVLKMRSWGDIGIGACVADALSRVPHTRHCEIFIPYFPARQDKTDGTAPITVAILAAMFSGCSRLHVFDIHSDGARSIIESVVPAVVTNWMPADLIIPKSNDVVGIIAPDEGAVRRAADFQTFFYPDADLIVCTKHRDQMTGHLSHYEIVTPLTRTGRYIIVDDICDGGGTFNLFADAFKKDAVGKHSVLEMFVSHGLFTKGLAAIDPSIERIVTTDSWCRIDPSVYGGRLEVVNLDKIYEGIHRGK